MNDPHVAALYYRVRHNETVEYSRATTLTFDEDLFEVEVKDGVARFGLKRHCATEAEAREIVDPFIRNWEFDAGLHDALRDFRLEFDKPEIVDRQPKAGHVRGNASPIKFHFRVSSPTPTVFPGSYPPPPSGIESGHPDVYVVRGFRTSVGLI